MTQLIDHAFTSSAWHSFELTDDEFFHEQTSPCWGVWTRWDAPRKSVVGKGDWVIDTHGGGPPLVPTIGWRVLHLAVWTEIYREWTFGIRRPRAEDYTYPGNATDAVAWLTSTQEAFTKAVHALGERDIATSRPTHYGTTRRAGDIVWDIAVEHLHHGAEIGLLRDLIRGRARDERWPGPWER